MNSLLGSYAAGLTDPQDSVPHHWLERVGGAAHRLLLLHSKDSGYGVDDDAANIVSLGQPLDARLHLRVEAVYRLV